MSKRQFFSSPPSLFCLFFCSVFLQWSNVPSSESRKLAILAITPRQTDLTRFANTNLCVHKVCHGCSGSVHWCKLSNLTKFPSQRQSTGVYEPNTSGWPVCPQLGESELFNSLILEINDLCKRRHWLRLASPSATCGSIRPRANLCDVAQRQQDARVAYEFGKLELRASTTYPRTRFLLEFVKISDCFFFSLSLFFFFSFSVRLVNKTATCTLVSTHTFLR